MCGIKPRAPHNFSKSLNWTREVAYFRVKNRALRADIGCELKGRGEIQLSAEPRISAHTHRECRLPGSRRSVACVLTVERQNFESFAPVDTHRSKVPLI